MNTSKLSRNKLFKIDYLEKNVNLPYLTIKFYFTLLNRLYNFKRMLIQFFNLIKFNFRVILTSFLKKNMCMYTYHVIMIRGALYYFKLVM